MSHNYRHRRAYAVRALGALGALAGTLLGLVASAPAAFAIKVPATFGAGAAPTGLSPTVPHAVVAGGMPGWQITVIVVLAALLAGTIAVIADRMRAARRSRVVPAT
jgi:hypothetical protein